MIVYNEPWTSAEAAILKELIGKKTVDEAKALYPNYKFQPANKRGDEDVEYENLINYKTDSEGKITHIAFG